MKWNGMLLAFFCLLAGAIVPTHAQSSNDVLANAVTIISTAYIDYSSTELLRALW